VAQDLDLAGIASTVGAPFLRVFFAKGGSRPGRDAVLAGEHFALVRKSTARYRKIIIANTDPVGMLEASS
jgi:hypothetical protein